MENNSKFKETVKKNRSYRGYDESRKITREELLELVDCARFAPSSVNRQPFKYLLANTPEDLDKIQPLTGWARALPHMKLPHPGKCPTAFIVICQDTKWDADLNRYIRDVGIVAQTMLLASVEQGLGGIMIGNFSPERLSKALELPENIVPMLIVALGKPDEQIVLTEIDDGESIQYYRDEQDIHYVPKRKLEDIVL
ncbi:MAG: nitroreductase family protein [Oscillospiraceae bacterium]|nr:nitroreductase family protein [Oscillospiraceae bacterium]